MSYKLCFISVVILSSAISHGDDFCGKVVSHSDQCLTAAGADCSFSVIPSHGTDRIDLVAGDAAIASKLKELVGKDAIVSVASAESGDAIAMDVRAVATCP